MRAVAEPQLRAAIVSNLDGEIGRVTVAPQKIALHRPRLVLRVARPDEIYLWHCLARVQPAQSRGAPPPFVDVRRGGEQRLEIEPMGERRPAQ